jgi:2-polyprenyl-3-methyl-5-hydroxy-6-metoxy-1,4-benzoquinol methylase
MNSAKTEKNSIKLACFCDNKQPELFIAGKTNLVKCHNCKLVYRDVEVSLKKVQTEFENLKYPEINKSPIEISVFKQRLVELEKAVGDFQGKKLLDFGTGASIFPYIARDDGWDVTGSDLDKRIVAIHKKNGIRMIDYQDLKDNSFDAIACFLVFEHLPQPDKMLEFLYRKLKKGGILMIEVPNINSLTVKLFKEKSAYVGTGDLYCFSIKTLTDLFEKRGFSVIKTRYKGMSSVAQIAGIKKKFTKSGEVENMYKYLKPAAVVYKHACVNLKMSDCIQVIGIKK